MPNELRFDDNPVWYPLLGDPHFEKIVTSLAPEEVRAGSPNRPRAIEVNRPYQSNDGVDWRRSGRPIARGKRIG